MINQIIGVFVIKRDNGLCLYTKICRNGDFEKFGTPQNDKLDILGGFISAVSTIVTHVADDYIKTMRLEGESKIKIMVETGQKIAVAVVVNKIVTDRKVFRLATNLVKQFNYLYKDILKDWKGDLSRFKMFDKIVDTEIGNTNTDFTDFL